MKRILSVLFLLMVTVMAVFPKPLITIAGNYVNLGDLPQETKKFFSISVKNSGTTELQIKDILTPCGCTKASLSTDHIPSDGEAQIIIVFDTGKFLGKVKKNIEIISNDKEIPNYKVYFEVNIYPEFSADPGICAFDRIVRRLGNKMNISIKHKDDKAFALERIEYDKDLFDISWQPIHAGNLFTCDVILTVKPAIRRDKLEEEIRFFFKLDNIKQFTLPVSSVITDNDLFFEPNLVRFTEKIKEVHIFLKSNSNTPFLLKEIKNSNPDIQATFTKTMDSEYSLTFFLTNTKRRFFDTVTMITDIPEEKEKILKVNY